MRVDLNADVGEGSGQDRALMPHITSANVACGVHAGNPATMRETVVLAREHGVAVGAHPSFPDRAGFGRRDVDMPVGQLREVVASQIDTLAAIAASEGIRLQHVKPHGALFNTAVRNRAIADAIAGATASVDPALMLFGLPGSAVSAAGAAAGLRTVSEAFADRAYLADGTLVPRTEEGAVIDDEAQVLARIVMMARGHLTAIDGTQLRIAFETICVHGDTPGAANLAARIRATLAAKGIRVTAIGRP